MGTTSEPDQPDGAAASRERDPWRGLSFDDVCAMRWMTVHEPPGYVWILPQRVPDETAEPDAEAAS
jgi:hypothetical protein